MLWAKIRSVLYVPAELNPLYTLGPRLRTREWQLAHEQDGRLQPKPIMRLQQNVIDEATRKSDMRQSREQVGLDIRSGRMQSKLVFLGIILVMTKTRAGRPLPMILLLIPFLYLVFSNPLGEPAQTIVEVVYLCILLGITVWKTTRNADEVAVAAARFSASAGAYAGIVCSVGLLIVMTRVPAIAEFIATLAESRANDLPPAAAGFGLGALAAILLILVCSLIAYSAWFWRSTQ